MKFSLIVATYGEKNKLHELFDSLEMQTNNNFEVIIVDQNKNNNNSELLEEYKFKSIFLKSEIGLSRARNKGIKMASGEILLFPDDDCRYPNNLLEDIEKLFSNTKIDCLTFKGTDESGKPIARFDTTSSYSNIYNIWNRVCSIGLAIKAEVIGDGFNESLGLGSGTKWMAGEDYELPIRLIKGGYRVYYDDNLVCFHDVPNDRGCAEKVLRAQQHSPALGYIWKLHEYPFWFVSYYFGRNILAIILSCFKFDRYGVEYYLASLIGKFKGYYKL